MDLGIPDDQLGVRDHARNSQIHSFFPGDRQRGNVPQVEQITLDSGLMNPELLWNYDEETRNLWRRTRVADWAQAIIAHELAEHMRGGDHELALIAGPETNFPTSRAARAPFRQMDRGRLGK
jgi:hypothetical protein